MNIRGRSLLLALSVATLFSVVGLSNCQAQKTVLYYFTSKHCAPCKRMEPTIQWLHKRGHQVYVIDIQAQPSWAKHFGVTQTPTSVIVSDNVVYGRQTGIIEANRLEQALSKASQLAAANTQNRRSIAQASGTQMLDQVAANQPSRTSPRQNDVQPLSVPVSRNNEREVYVSSGLSPKQKAHRATVRLSVEDPEGISHGTGTIVHVKGKHALILTCGHIFRESRGKGTIKVDYGFADGKLQTSDGKLLACDWNSRDVALVTMQLDSEIEPVELASANFLPRQGDAAFSVGCSRGRAPTVMDCRVKRTARYGLGNDPFMAMKIDTTNKPTDGRSGGGLFDDQGRLIGVCNAMAEELDEGIYSSLENVFWQLKELKLDRIIAESQQQTLVASNRNTRSVNPARGASLRQVANTREEWEVTVRSRKTGETFTIPAPSQRLLQTLAAESRLNPNERIATRPQDMPDVSGIRPQRNQQYRAQSPR